MSNYFLLLHKNKKYISNIKQHLLQKADEIVSQDLLEKMTQTGSSYKYDKLIEEKDSEWIDVSETLFYITFRNCNSLCFNQVSELICKIEPVEFIQDEETQTEKITTNLQHEENTDFIEVDTFEKIDTNDDNEDLKSD